MEMRRTCERCGRKHVAGWTWLELNTYTGTWHRPGTLAADDSQGLFPFGVACALSALKETERKPSLSFKAVSQ
jgi:hypothetical protein